jgi:hypothetical protein
VASVDSMRLFKRSAGEQPTPEAPVTPAQDPVLEPLTNAETDWVRSNIAGLADQDVRLGDIDDLGRHYDEMLSGWLRLDETQRPDPNDVITQIGLAFGQFVGDHAKLDWTIATDEYGAEIALHRTRGNVLIYPTNLVAKRWAAEELHALPALARDMIATVEQLP